MHDYTGLSAPSVLQYALARYCEKTDFGKEYVHGIQKKLAENYAFLSTALSKLGFKIAKANNQIQFGLSATENGDDSILISENLY